MSQIVTANLKELTGDFEELELRLRMERGQKLCRTWILRWMIRRGLQVARRMEDGDLIREVMWEGRATGRGSGAS